jgi:hypothetical protein
MSHTLDSHELLVLIFISGLFAVILGFMVSNFGYHTTEKNVITFKNNTSTFQPVQPPFDPESNTDQHQIVVPCGISPCGIVRTL